MQVKVRLFAILRERAGADSVELELADGATATDAIDAVADRHGLGELLQRLPIAVAVNREYAEREHVLDDGDEVALIPPVSGGAERVTAPVHVRVTGEGLSVDALSRMVGRAEAGAIVTFQGTTRRVERLEYEAYTEMAEEKIAAILNDAIERHGLRAAAAEHRVGAVPLGEPSVVVAVSASHRGEAFAAAREVIDRIKSEAPIWKKEVGTSEEGQWVEGASPGAQRA
jgi:molybdopterin converting factor subunit 1